MEKAWSALAIIGLVAVGCRGDREAARRGAEAPAPEKVVAGSFVVAGPEDGLLPAGITVYDAGEHAEPRWEGLAEEQYELAPGRYDVLIEYFGQKYWRRGVELAGGEEAVKLPMGTLALEARSSRGDRLEGDVAVYPAVATGGPPAMEGETFEGLAVLAGTYDVRVTLQGRERWLRGVTVGEGDYETRALIEPVGYLRAEVLDQDGKPLEAEVWVYGPASGHVPAALGKSNRPLALLPGRYDLAVRWAGTRDFSSGVAVVENQTTVERFTFWRSEAR
ncbi:MAG: hypothetical protein GTN49_11880 [candidate division Zixibacteria bacterium]|nr:hypothetical protein [candidate division Zixibacteria bacterium]